MDYKKKWRKLYETPLNPADRNCTGGYENLEILWTDGSASTTFAINANTSGKKDDVPKTGDNTPIVWLFILVVLSGTGLILAGKKGKKNLETLRK